MFWISHHRRLARQPVGSRGMVILNLFFLLSIVLLPVTNGLYTNYSMSSAVAVLYGLHLTAIAGLNAWLWWTILGGWRHEIMASMFPLLVFIPGTIVAAFAPHVAPFVWFIAFGGLADPALLCRADRARRVRRRLTLLSRRTRRPARKA